MSSFPSAFPILVIGPKSNSIFPFFEVNYKPRSHMTEKDITIFVVDDDESVCRSLKRLLKSAGYRVETFNSAEDFLEFTIPKGRSVLLLDIRMPVMSGLDLQKKLVDEGSNIPIIFMTAHEDLQAETQALSYGAVAFLKKPFHDELLFEAIRAGVETKD